jgi:hypothetical protein
MALKMALTIAGGYLAVAQGLTMILTDTMTALILGVATPFLVLGGCVAYVLERETRPELPPHRTAPRVIDVPPRRFRKAAWCSGSLQLRRSCRYALGHANASETLDTSSHLWPADEGRWHADDDRDRDERDEAVESPSTAAPSGVHGHQFVSGWAM